MYTVIKHFTDLKDGGYFYHEGDRYPRRGLEVSAERFDELATEKNIRKTPLIKLVKETAETPVETTKKTRRRKRSAMED